MGAGVLEYVLEMLLRPFGSSSLLATVEENKEFFTRGDIERANADRKLQEYIGWPRTQDFKL